MIKIRFSAVLLSVFLLPLVIPPEALDCSRVMWAEDGYPVLVGRTMDWFEDIRTNLWVLPRGISRDGGAGENSLRWTAKHGSLVATAYDMCST
ncbi:MAG TPA: linear amide C-N hydrolase [Thermodesulfobacteriota bacterium]|nr:linear amide C-N hydrolase [Thermodesulfobacteriota bacterium]